MDLDEIIEKYATKFKSYKVDSFLLSNKWIEERLRGDISYVIRGGKTREKHDRKVEEIKNTLLSENDDNYTSWAFTYKKYNKLTGFDPHVTVLHFRIRDAW